MSTRQLGAIFFAWGLVICASVQAETVFSDAIPYTQAGQAAPFFNTTWPITIEDFEDNSVHPFIVEITGSILQPNFSTGPDNLTDSVDGDDGNLDGSGNDGYSFFNAGRAVMISFADPVPAAGLVWTDSDRDSARVTLEAFDDLGMSLGLKDYGKLSDGEITGQTAEDRFLGVEDNGGIKTLLVTNAGPGNGIEIDHVQWHEFVPEPSSSNLALIATSGLMLLRRRK